MYITVKSIKRDLGFKGIEVSDIIIALPVLIIFIILFYVFQNTFHNWINDCYILFTPSKCK